MLKTRGKRQRLNGTPGTFSWVMVEESYSRWNIVSFIVPARVAIIPITASIFVDIAQD